MKSNKTESKIKVFPFEGVWFQFKTCWKYNYKYIVLLFANTIIEPISARYSLSFSQKILSSVFPEKGLIPNYLLGLQYMAYLILLVLVVGFLQNLIGSRLDVEKALVLKDFQLELAEKTMRIRFERTETAEFLDLKAKADQFISSGGSGFGGMVESAFGLLATFMTMGVYIGYLSDLEDPLLIILVIVLTGFTILINYLLNKKNIEINLEKAKQERRTQYYGTVTQHFTYGKEIRGNGCNEWISGKYKDQLNILQRFYEKMARYGIKYGSLLLAVNIFQRAITYTVLIMKTKAGLIPDAGRFGLMLQAVEGLSGGLKSMVGGLTSLNQFNKYYESFKEYYSLINSDAKEDSSLPLPDISNRLTIRFDDVCFRYPGMETDALSHVSCEINKNDIISIVGDNGAGKSTFIKLLLRLYTPTSGKITLNGTDVSLINRQDYIRHFACVFQDFKLFSFSVKDNIELGCNNDEGSEQTVEEAIQFSGLDDKIKSLEKNIETMIYREFDPNGYTPSGGESQRLALARAFYRNGDILILDEPTAALDPNIEYEINNRIRSELHGEKTIINVSHRLHSVRYSNKIFVFSGGQLVESGTHDALFSRPTIYRKMFERQASDYVDMSSLSSIETDN